MKSGKTTQGIVLDVYVKTNSKKFQIKTEEGEVVLFCRETPVKGRVNRELMKELSRLFKRRVEILSGFSSRRRNFWSRTLKRRKSKRSWLMPRPQTAGSRHPKFILPQSVKLSF